MEENILAKWYQNGNTSSLTYINKVSYILSFSKNLLVMPAG